MGCRYVKKTATYCDKPVEFVLDVGFSGLGACRQHVGQMIGWVLSDSASCTVYELHRWEAARELEAQGE